MSDSVLLTVQRACGAMGLDRPTAVVTSGTPNGSDATAAQMFDLLNDLGDELAELDWSFLVTEGATITLVSGQGSYSLPSDFERVVPRTEWDRTQHWETLGPDSPQVARMRRESVFQVAPRRALRFSGSNLLVWPTPGTSDAGAVIAYDYVSANWALRSATPAASVTNDADTYLFASKLMRAGLRAKFKLAKGLDAGVDMMTFARMRDALFASDQTRDVIRLDGESARDLDEDGNADFVLPGPIVGLPTG